jgi:adenylate kinase family enzyme
LALINDPKLSSVLDKLIPSLKGLDKTRLLFGFPKTLNQVHMLRERNIYPDKVLVVNYAREHLLTRLIAKLSDKFPQELDAKKRAHELLVEYDNNLGQVKEVYRDIVIEVDSSKESIDSRVAVTT